MEKSNQRQLIVIVDDDPSMCQATQRLLNAAGLTTVGFASAEALLQSDAVTNAGCYIIDLQLPGLSGFELERQLRVLGDRAPVVFITAYDHEASRDKAATQGAAAYFAKPYAGRDLLQTLAKAMDMENIPPGHETV